MKKECAYDKDRECTAKCVARSLENKGVGLQAYCNRGKFVVKGK